MLRDGGQGVGSGEDLEVAVDLGIEPGAVDDDVGRELQRHFLHGEGIPQDGTWSGLPGRPWPLVAPRVEPGVWQRAGRAINQRERLCLRYQRFDGATRDYLLEPYHLVVYHGNWYLLALNAAVGRIETFALSRCRSIEGAGQHFARHVGFHAPAFFKDALGISQANKPWKVRLLFARDVAGNRRRMGISLRSAVASTQRREGAETQGFRLLGTFTRRGTNSSPSFPPRLPAPCAFASWRLCVNRCLLD